MTLFPVRDYETHSQVRMETLIISSSRRLTSAQLPQSSRIAASSYFSMAPLTIWTISSDRGLGSTSFSPGVSMVFLTMQGLFLLTQDTVFNHFQSKVSCAQQIFLVLHIHLESQWTVGHRRWKVSPLYTFVCLIQHHPLQLLLSQVHWSNQGCDVHRVLC